VSDIRLLQLYAGGRHVAVVDIFRTGPEALSLLNCVDIRCIGVERL
jgi:hypothetical protein